MTRAAHIAGLRAFASDSAVCRAALKRKTLPACGTVEHKSAAGKVSEIEAAIARLETKRQDIVARQRDAAPAPKSDNKPKDSRTAKRMDRLDAMERRVGFGASAEKSDAEVDAEIASLGEQSAIDAEIAAMKAPAKKALRKKAK